MTTTSEKDALAHALTEIYDGCAHARYGLDEISQREHALQTAAAAERANEPPSFILAALLHDIGHMIHALGENPAADHVDDRHEILGADWLAARLGPAVSEPVRLHVEAKRYLCAINPDYAKRLAPDSVLSLSLQGGPMTEEEATRFKEKPFAREALRLRAFDEAAKDPRAKTPSFDHFLRYLAALP